LKVTFFSSREIKNSSAAILGANISSWAACVNTWTTDTIFIRTASPTIISNLTTGLIAITISVAISATNNSIGFERGEEESEEEKGEER